MSAGEELAGVLEVLVSRGLLKRTVALKVGDTELRLEPEEEVATPDEVAKAREDIQFAAS